MEQTIAIHASKTVPVQTEHMNMAALVQSLLAHFQREGDVPARAESLRRGDGMSRFEELREALLSELNVRTRCAEQGELILLHLPLSFACFYFCTGDSTLCTVGPFRTKPYRRQDAEYLLREMGISDTEKIHALLLSYTASDADRITDLSRLLARVLGKNLVVLDARHCCEHLKKCQSLSAFSERAREEALAAHAEEQVDLLIGKLFLAFQSGDQKQLHTCETDLSTLILQYRGKREVLKVLRIYLQVEIAEIASNQFDKTHERRSVLLLSSFMDRIRAEESAEGLVRLQHEFLQQAWEMVWTKTSETFSSDRRIRTLMEYIRVHYAEKLTLPMLAETVGLGSSYLSGLFRKETGMTLSAYIRSVRIEHAQLLLHYLTIPVTEVAYQCGYQDTSYFIKEFRKETGYAPTEFRRVRDFIREPVPKAQ